ncbi:MAG: FHA domain-containing protein [Thermodesulfobacteriota bacterium]|nr:FHA domain-containing protein [Thermodesulfobacteriota bacterium]
MIKLILKLKDTQIEEFNLEKGLITIGRAKENEVMIDNIAVSRKHAQVELKEGAGYVLSDLNSSNGTFLNGVRIDANDHPLRDGDVISVAKFQIQVKGLARAPQPAPRDLPQPDVEGTMIFAAAKRKPGPEAQATPEQKAFQWPSLSAAEGPRKGTNIKISKDVTILGKGSGDDIPVEGWFISSPHARISRRGDRFYISHLGGFFSSTKVNGIKIKEEHILKNKDEIKIGNSTFIYTH